ncbi:hypothetical protein [Amycolatopsis acidicola]|nr:hypothetical protein [Amycolatopsis acidicola]
MLNEELCGIRSAQIEHGRILAKLNLGMAQIVALLTNLERDSRERDY